MRLERPRLDVTGQKRVSSKQFAEESERKSRVRYGRPRRSRLNEWIQQPDSVEVRRSTIDDENYEAQFYVPNSICLFVYRNFYLNNYIFFKGQQRSTITDLSSDVILNDNDGSDNFNASICSDNRSSKEDWQILELIEDAVVPSGNFSSEIISISSNLNEFSKLYIIIVCTFF